MSRLPLFAATVAVAAFVLTCPAAAQDPPPDFTIAFIGDQGDGANAVAVLRLIADEGADAVVHSGDFDYDGRPARWDAMITSVLGADFPYFASVGNHDDTHFYGPGGYQEFLEARLKRIGVPWNGDLGVRSTLRYRGILIVLTAPGVFGDGDTVYAPYIRRELGATRAVWRISSWHKNMRALQAGVKSDESGWGVYEESRRGGAIIATGHAHSYSRTHLLSHMQSQTCAIESCAVPSDDTLVLKADDPGTPTDEGRSFAFVSGLGGKSARAQLNGGPWFASIHTATQGATYGALFGVFNRHGDPRLAYFYFKNLNGVIADEFSVRSLNAPTSPTQPGR
jgi:hypothetical protein